MGRPFSLVLYYDASCPLCQFFVRIVAALDRNRQVRAIATDCSCTGDGCQQMVAVSVNGQEFRGFDAIVCLARQLPVTRPLTPVLSLPLVRQLGRRLYRWVAKRRYKISHIFGRFLEGRWYGAKDESRGERGGAPSLGSPTS